MPFSHELGPESFEEAIERVRRLKAELELLDDGERPLLVSHGIFIRFFLLDSVLGDDFAAPMAGRIWHLALPQLRAQRLRAARRARPVRRRNARLDLRQLDGAAMGSAVTARGGSSGETCHCSLTIAPGGGSTGPSSSGSAVSRIQASSRPRIRARSSSRAGSAATLFPS